MDTCSRVNLVANEGGNYINSALRFRAVMSLLGKDPALCNNDYRAGSGVYAPICKYTDHFGNLF